MMYFEISPTAAMWLARLQAFSERYLLPHNAAWQGQGLGRFLLAKMLRYLRERGTGEVTGQCLLENGGMAELARYAGFEVEPGEDTVAMRLVLHDGV